MIFKKKLTYTRSAAQLQAEETTEAMKKKNVKTKTYQTREDQLWARGNDNTNFQNDEEDEQTNELMETLRAQSLLCQQDLSDWSKNVVHLENPKLPKLIEQRYTTMLKSAPNNLINPVDVGKNMNKKQKLVANIIISWCKQSLIGNQLQLDPLRLFVIGVPGAGKTTVFKYVAAKLIEDQSFDFVNRVRVGCPTGCTAYNMGYGAKTNHKVFMIKVGHVGENLDATAANLIQLKEHLASDSLLIMFFDECSMVDRAMFYAITSRLTEAGIDLNKIGFVFFGDPAQNAPVTGQPMWCSSLKTDKYKKCSNSSINGITAFRTLMGMRPASDLPGYCDIASKDKEKKMKAQSMYRRHLYNGKYQAVYMNKSNRIDGSKESISYTKFLRRIRYGNVEEKDIHHLRKVTATCQEVKSDNANWKNKTVLTDYHFFSEISPERSNADFLNAQQLIAFNKQNNQYPICFESVNTSATAAKQPASQFNAMPRRLYMGIGAPIILTTNINPSIGLFNGAQGFFQGGIYFKKSYNLKSLQKMREMGISHEFKTEHQCECSVQGTSINENGETSSKTVIFPRGTKVISINGNEVNLEVFNSLSLDSDFIATLEMGCEPPFLPEFLIIDFPGYTGPAFFPNAENINFVPVRQVKHLCKGYSKTSIGPKPYRIGFPVELAFVMTAFKGIGANHERTEARLKGFFSKPGFFYVGISRVRNPKHVYIPEDHFPTQYDLLQQRQMSSVIESECFEREVRIKSARIMRTISFDDIARSKKFKNCIVRNIKLFNAIADEIVTFWRNNGPFDIDSMNYATYISKIHNHNSKIPIESFASVSQYLEQTDESLLLKSTPQLSDTDKLAITKMKKSRKTEKPVDIISSPKKGKTAKAMKRQQETQNVICLDNDIKSPVRKMSKISKTHSNKVIVNDEDVDFVISSVIGIGFYNDNNCCYINSVLQLLFTIQPDNLFQQNLHLHHSSVNNEFRLIHNNYISSPPGTTLEVLPIMHALCNENNTFQLNQQSDAFEFLNVLCEYVGTLLFDAENVTTILRSCCEPSVTTQPIQHTVHFDISRIDNTWEELISSYTEIEYTCDSCGVDGGNDVIKTHTTYFNSQYAIVVLKIYSQDQYGHNIKLKPKFSLDNSFENNNFTYKVQSVVFHYGEDVNAGHYITKRKGDGHNEWIVFDDYNLSIENKSNILHLPIDNDYQPYLILLQREI